MKPQAIEQLVAYFMRHVEEEPVGTITECIKIYENALIESQHSDVRDSFLEYLQGIPQLSIPVELVFLIFVSLIGRSQLPLSPKRNICNYALE